MNELFAGGESKRAAVRSDYIFNCVNCDYRGRYNVKRCPNCGGQLCRVINFQSQKATEKSGCAKQRGNDESA